MAQCPCMKRIRKPLNTTVAPDFLKEVREKSELLDIPIGTLLEDAWTVARGDANPVSVARLQMVFASKPQKRAA
jgi:hypothetical protein